MTIRELSAQWRAEAERKRLPVRRGGQKVLGLYGSALMKCADELDNVEPRSLVLRIAALTAWLGVDYEADLIDAVGASIDRARKSAAAALPADPPAPDQEK